MNKLQGLWSAEVMVCCQRLLQESWKVGALFDGLKAFAKYLRDFFQLQNSRWLQKVLSVIRWILAFRFRNSLCEGFKLEDFCLVSHPVNSQYGDQEVEDSGCHHCGGILGMFFCGFKIGAKNIVFPYVLGLNKPKFLLFSCGWSSTLGVYITVLKL